MREVGLRGKPVAHLADLVVGQDSHRRRLPIITSLSKERGENVRPRRDLNRCSVLSGVCDSKHLRKTRASLASPSSGDGAGGGSVFFLLRLLLHVCVCDRFTMRMKYPKAGNFIHGTWA